MLTKETHPVGSRHRRPRRVAIGSILVGAWLLATASPRARADDAVDFLVIVHSSNPLTSANRTFVADAFLKATSRWDDGELIRPVDLRSSSPVRAAFTDRVLRRSVLAVRSYWQQRIFSGRDVPPPELDTDEAVVAFVAEHRGSVGYVTKSAKLGGAKAIAIQ
jgi:ABC-type phosphate transport system substrate-binding protein